MRDDPKGWLYRSVDRQRRVTDRRLSQDRRLSDGQAPRGSWRRARQHVLSHLPGDRITAYLQNGGTLETAQQIANHESPRMTKLYDRSDDTLTLDEIEQITL